MTSSEVGRFNPAATNPPSKSDAAATITLEPQRARISANADGTCAISSKGRVRCWGDNRAGTLGNGDYELELSATPVDVKGLGANNLGVFGGVVGQCAVGEDSTARCWGDVVFGTFESMPQTHFVTYSPVAVDGLRDIAAIAIGTYFHCALTLSGGVKCWGLGGAGQLGNGALEDRVVPTDVPLPGPAIAIAAGQGTFFACAVLDGGAVSCWGENEYGQLGSGDREATRSPIATQPLPAKARAITAGRAHACALLEDGTVACWGANDESQLGRSGGDRVVASIVEGVDGVVAIAAGGRQTCVRNAANDIRCFGDGDPKPRVVARGAVEMAVGFQHGCAVLESDRVQCWGVNDRGQLGPFDGQGAAL